MSISITPSQDDFIPAVSRTKRRKGRTHALRSLSFAARLRNVTMSIANSEWSKVCRNKIEMSLDKLGWEPPDILCLGLGCPTESLNAAAQLGLVVSICDSLEIARGRVSFFDPHFTQEDMDGLLEMRFSVLSENKLGKYALRCRTLLVMPHCGVGLYENVLRENWGVEELGRLLLIGNVLEDYATTSPAAKLELETPCVSRIWKHLVCDPISPSEDFPYAFNNLGLQYVRTNSLPQSEDAIWKLPHPNPKMLPSAEIVS